MLSACKHAFLGITLAALAVSAQSVGPEFEVASVRPVDPPPAGQRFVMTRTTGGPGTKDPNNYSCKNCSLTIMVQQAYDLQRFQLRPQQWMDDLRFDVIAKVPEGATKDQFKLMLQRLLAERFKLAAHHEPKEMDAFELVIGKGGPKLKESVDDAPVGEVPPPGPLPKDKDGLTMVPPGATIFETTNGVPWARLNASKETMQSFVGRLANYLRTPVFDATGLKGKYDFMLTWSPDLVGMGVPPAPPTSAGEPPPPLAPDGPTLHAAVQSQLGLKLEPRKRQVDILMLDHAEKVPTEN
jgi:uncharacterized protein (TIGR03435 family)